MALHDVPTTEWPIFGSVFYLMATAELQDHWERGEHPGEPAPRQYAAAAITAAKDLILDPAHHTWVRTHWGDGYLHRENVFFRGLLIAGLTSYLHLTADRSVEPLLRDQVETMVAELDRSRRGVLNDYPGECYPIDVLATIGFIQRADAVLGTNHQAFLSRARRGFTGPMADSLGLVPFRIEIESGAQEQPSRGVGNSWILLFAPDLWPERARTWYALYEQWFWQDHGWAAGFREYARSTASSEWLFEIDAGPVLDGFGTAASAFGIAAARRNGRFDHAYTLSAQMMAMAWPLPDGTLLGPRVLSHAATAPYLGESAILYFLTVTPATGVPIVTGGTTPWLVKLVLLLDFGLSLLICGWAAWGVRRLWLARRVLG